MTLSLSVSDWIHKVRVTPKPSIIAFRADVTEVNVLSGIFAYQFKTGMDLDCTMHCWMQSSTVMI